MLGRILENVDVLAGNEEDLQGLGIPGPVALTVELDPSTCCAMIDQVAARHPQVEVVATTREVRDNPMAGRRRLGQGQTAPPMVIWIFDRVGGGDGCGLHLWSARGESPEKR